ncbi:MAG: DNA-directed RNA polymerase subunit omega [Candidatus Zixiibacteriota bacterium]|nr:MAG: DNA-directed RNA polymerase subunit omega [candidate division Zixibacteria bacterium]
MFMPYIPLDNLEQVTKNRYEAVIVAAKHARHLNSARLMEFKRAEESEGTIEVDPRKITMVALKDLLEGKVKFERADTE